ncbi:MAG: hypothetical protein ABEI80_04460 [Haloplanus sp.]
MHRRAYLEALGSLVAAASLAGCSASEPSAATPTADRTSAAPTRTTRSATRTDAETNAPTPGDRSLDPYRTWLVAPTPATPDAYAFTHLSLSAVRSDASEAFAARLDDYWRQRTRSYFGFDVPVDALDAVLTVNHSRVANESYRVAEGTFDVGSLRASLAAAGFEADGYVGDVRRFVRTENGRLRVVGLHPDVLLSIGTEPTATEPLATAVRQHDAGDYRARSGGLGRLIDHFGAADFVTGRNLDPVDGDYPLSEAVATGRRLDVRQADTWAERAYVLAPGATVERAAVEEVIRERHVGQPIEEYRRDGRVVTVAGTVDTSLIRLL